jgi:hypothetical protein
MILKIIDLLIGLTVIYLIFSTITSSLAELVENLLRRRGALLKQGLKELVESVLPKNVAGTSVDDLLKAIYQTPHIASLFRGPYEDNKTRNLPSYLPADRFIGALRYLSITVDGPYQNLRAVMANIGGPAEITIDMQKQIDGARVAVSARQAEHDRIRADLATSRLAVPPDAEAITKLLVELEAAGKSLQQALKSLADIEQDSREAAAIAKYFEQSMERVSGWYMRHVSVVLLVFGFLIAGILNIDTLQLAKGLLADNDMRSRIVESANAMINKGYDAAVDKANACSPTDTDCLEKVRQRVAGQLAVADGIGVTIGWSRCEWTSMIEPTKDCPSVGVFDQRNAQEPGSCDIALNFLMKFFGILLTAIAISAGAPFWFDLMGKLVQLRNTVKPVKVTVSASAPTSTTPASGS